jgi:hypothetical protein
MSSSFDVIRIYNPDTLKLMAVAFERAWQSLPANVRTAKGRAENSRCSCFATLTGESMIQCAWPIWPCSIS